jgi:uncharacterized membrane protein YdcZ (DUF606 family)
MGAWIIGLLAKPDFEFTKFVCRTPKGLRLHSWGAGQAAIPRAVGIGEACGTVWIGGTPSEGCEVSLATAAGKLLTKVITDAKGTFCVQSSPGRFHLSVQAPMVVFTPDSLEVTIRHERIDGIAFHGVSGSEAGGPWSGGKRFWRVIARYLNWRRFLLACLLLAGGIWFARDKVEPETHLASPKQQERALVETLPREAAAPPVRPEPLLSAKLEYGPGSLVAGISGTAVTTPSGQPARGLSRSPRVADPEEVQLDSASSDSGARDSLTYEAEDQVVENLPSARAESSLAGVPGTPSLLSPAQGGAESPLPPTPPISSQSANNAVPVATGYLPSNDSGNNAVRQEGNTSLGVRSGKIIPRVNRAADSTHFEVPGSAGHATTMPDSDEPATGDSPEAELTDLPSVARPSVHIKPADGKRPVAVSPPEGSRNGTHVAAVLPGPAPNGAGTSHAVQVSHTNWRPALLHDVMLPTRPMPAGTTESLSVLRARLNQEMQAGRPQYLLTYAVRQGYRIEWTGQEGGARPSWEQVRGIGKSGNSVDEDSATIFWDTRNLVTDCVYVLRGDQEMPLATVRIRAKSGSLLVSDARVKVSVFHEIILAASGAALPQGADFRMELNTGAGSVRPLTPMIITEPSGSLCFRYLVPLTDLGRGASFAFSAGDTAWGLIGAVTLQLESAETLADWPPAD